MFVHFLWRYKAAVGIGWYSVVAAGSKVDCNVWVFRFKIFPFESHRKNSVNCIVVGSIGWRLFEAVSSYRLECCPNVEFLEKMTHTILRTE